MARFFAFFLILLGLLSGSQRSALGDDLFPTAPLVYRYPSQTVLKLDARRLGECMAWAAMSRSRAPSLIKETGLDHFDPDAFLAYLEASSHRKVDFRTNQEEKLKAWILSQKDNSVDPLNLFEESLSLHQGNVWNAVLAIHDLLRNHARWFDKRRYHYSSTLEASEALFNKLIDIRGDLLERGGRYSGDHAGSWYRLWGMMLYRLMFEDEHAPQEIEGCSPPPRDSILSHGTKNLIRDLDAALVARYAEWSKVNRPDELDHGKAKVNAEGARAIEKLLSEIWPVRGAPRNPTGSDLQKCHERDYLRSQ